jgi:hypothetical protein
MQPLVFGPLFNRQSQINNRQSTIANQQSPINNRQSQINNRQSQINNRQSYNSLTDRNIHFSSTLKIGTGTAAGLCPFLTPINH